MSSVSPDLRFSRNQPCPVCDGHRSLPRGKGERCAGFYSPDRQWAHCTREEYAGDIEPTQALPPTYAHWLGGPCNCGKTHGDGEGANGGQPMQKPKKQTRPRRNIGEPTPFYAVDASGTTLGVHMRQDFVYVDTGEPDKTMWWERHAGRSSTDMPLWNTPAAVMAAPDVPVWLCEGEKKAKRLQDELHAAGWADVVLATMTGASGTPCDDALRILLKRRVTFWPDHVADGKLHMRKIAQRLLALGADRATFFWVDWPDAPAKADAWDYFVGGGDIARLELLVKPFPQQQEESDSKREQWRPDVQSAYDLMRKELPPVRWTVHDLIPEGVTLMAAKPKKGKSALMMHIAMCVANNATACGYFETEQCEVLYLALEDNERRMQRRMRQMLQGEDPPKGFHITTKWLPLDAGGLDALQTYLDAHPAIHMIVADTLEHIRPKRRGNGGYSDDYASVRGIQQLAGDRQIAVVAITHLRKAPSDDPFDEINATMGLMASVDNALVLRPNNGILELHRRGRDFEDDTVLALKGDARTLLWRVEGKAEEVTRSVERKAIIEALKKDAKRKRDANKPADGMTPKAIALALGKNDVTVRRLLQKLLDEAKPPIRQDDAGHYHAIEEDAPPDPDPVHAFTPESDSVNGHQAASDQARDDLRSRRSQRSQQSPPADVAHPAEREAHDGVNSVNSVNAGNGMNGATSHHLGAPTRNDECRKCQERGLWDTQDGISACTNCGHVWDPTDDRAKKVRT
jgi:hypothetical protein